jgi:mitochondrial fission protein ELM1
VLHNRLLRASLLGINRSRSAPLEPPWPDLVIGAGRRAAPVAQWIREQNFGRTRLVQLGRKGGDAASRFDLVVTPSYGRLDPHPRRIETSAPLHGITEQRLDQGAEAWKTRLGEVARPRIVVLVGGRSGQYDLDDSIAERLGADVRRLAESTGGSILASTSRRTGAAESEAFCRALGAAAYVHRWSNTDADNPYHALLEAADAFVITGDSESMLGEAASSGRPIYVYPLPTRTSFRWLHVGRNWVYARAHRGARRRGGRHRGQRGVDYLCARLIDRGLVRPSRDLSRLHQDLYEAGVARHFGAPFDTKRCQPLSNREFVVERVHALMRYGPIL